MRINYNASAMRSVTILGQHEGALGKSSQRLSSGYKINRSKDNPSGYAMSRKMKLQIESLKQAGNNSSEGIDVIRTIDGTLSEVHDMLQRMNELAVKASNGTYSDEDRKLVNDEVKQLKEEIQRIADTTEFNGQKLLDGSFDLKGFTDNINVKVGTYSDSVEVGKYDITLTGTINFDPVDGTITSKPGDVGLTAPALTPLGVKISNITDNTITLTGNDGIELQLRVYKGYTAGTLFSVDITGYGEMTLQVGANEGQTVDIQIPSVSLESLGLKELDTSTEGSAKDAMDRVTRAIGMVSAIRSRLGAYENRLESRVDTIDLSVENMTSAYSGIMDTDMSEEYTQYSTYQILSQAGTSILAQANERPSQVLQLLQ